MKRIIIVLFTAVLYLLAIPCYLVIAQLTGRAARRAGGEKPVRKGFARRRPERIRTRVEPVALPYAPGFKPVGVVAEVEAE